MTLNSTDLDAEKEQLVACFQELRSWVDERLVAKGLYSGNAQYS
jgi:hypothetical protein